MKRLVMSSLISGSLALCCAGASAQPPPGSTRREGAPGPEVGSLRLVPRSAPWGRRLTATESCDGEELLVAEFVMPTGEPPGVSHMFSSRDGVRWRQEHLPDGFMLLSFQCLRGVLFALGRPGMLVRRSAPGRWALEIVTPFRIAWRRRAELILVEPDPSSPGGGGMVAYGLNGNGRPLEYRYDPATAGWVRRPHPAARSWPQPTEEELARACRHASPPREDRAAPITGARVCPHALLVRRGPEGSGAPEVIPLPAPLRESWEREERWETVVVAGQVFLTRCDHGGLRRPDRTRVVRLAGGAWAEASVEGCAVVARWRGRALLLARGVMYEIEGGAGGVPSAREVQP